MSRLDSFIRRLMAQRDCLEMAAGMIAGMPGPVLEVGLGNGRTYDHLRCLLPEREIFVFDRRIAAHPDCVPDDGHMILGEITDTLPGALARIGSRAALVHADIGSGDAATNAGIAAFLGRALPALTVPGAVIVSDQDLGRAGWDPQALPEGVTPGRYFIFRQARGVGAAP